MESSHIFCIHVRLEDSFALVKMIPVEILCRMRRLGLLFAIVQHAEPNVWALLGWEEDWLQHAREDLKWLWTHSARDLPQPSRQSWGEWRDFICHKPSRPKAMIRRAGERALQSLLIERCSRFVAGPLVKWHAVRHGRDVEESSTWFWCGPCERAFVSRAALASHFFQKHGRKARYRHVLEGTVCVPCGKDFVTAARLALHLKGSRVCCERLEQAGKWSLHVAAGIGSRSWRQAIRDDLGLMISKNVQVALDTSHNAGHFGFEPAVNAAFLQVCDALLEDGTFGLDIEAITDAVSSVLTSHPLFIEEIHRILAWLCDGQGPAGTTIPFEVIAAVDAHYSHKTAMRSRGWCSDWLERLCEAEGNGCSRDTGPCQAVCMMFEADGSCGSLSSFRLVTLKWAQGSLPSDRDLAYWPPSKLCSFSDSLLLLFKGLTTCQGRLRAPPDFWKQAYSMPFRVFRG